MPTGRRTTWQCPRCRRRFAKRNQWHSCRPLPPSAHFRNKPKELWSIYNALVRGVRQFGPVRIDAVKTGINLTSRYHFGGVDVRRDYLRVGFLSDKVIRNTRIVKTQRLGPAKVAHTVWLRTCDDVDDQLLGWFRRAYTLQSD